MWNNAISGPNPEELPVYNLLWTVQGGGTSTWWSGYSRHISIKRQVHARKCFG